MKLCVHVVWEHVYHVSLKSETVGFNSLGDLTQNDPVAKFPNNNFISVAGNWNRIRSR